MARNSHYNRTALIRHQYETRMELAERSRGTRMAPKA